MKCCACATFYIPSAQLGRCTVGRACMFFDSLLRTGSGTSAVASEIGAGVVANSRRSSGTKVMAFASSVAVM